MNKIYKILKYTFVSILLLLSLQTNAHSEEADKYLLKEGDKVRVYSKTHHIGKVVGTFIKYENDSLYMESKYARYSGGKSSSFHTYSSNSIDRLQISNGRKNNSGRLAVIFGMASAIITAIQISIIENNPNRVLEYEKSDIYLGRLIFGTLFGALVGALIKSEKWEDVPLENLKLSFDFSPQYNNRLEISLSLSF